MDIIRVQCFSQRFFSVSLCFKRFWAAVNILKLVLKKFNIQLFFYLILPFVLQKNSPPLIKVEEKNLVEKDC